MAEDEVEAEVVERVDMAMAVVRDGGTAIGWIGAVARNAADDEAARAASSAVNLYFAMLGRQDFFMLPLLGWLERDKARWQLATLPLATAASTQLASGQGW